MDLEEPGQQLHTPVDMSPVCLSGWGSLLGLQGVWPIEWWDMGKEGKPNVAPTPTANQWVVLAIAEPTVVVVGRRNHDHRHGVSTPATRARATAVFLPTRVVVSAVMLTPVIVEVAGIVIRRWVFEITVASHHR